MVYFWPREAKVDTVGVSCFKVHLCGYALLPVIGGQWYTFDLGRQKSLVDTVGVSCFCALAVMHRFGLVLDVEVYISVGVCVGLVINMHWACLSLTMFSVA